MRVWIYEQAGALPFRVVDGSIHILLITNRKKTKWLIPKGLIDNPRYPEETASNEAMEEAGVKGQLFPFPVAHYSYKKWGGTCCVRVYLMEVQEQVSEFLEKSMRELRWCSVDEAVSLVDNEELSDIINAAPEVIASLHSSFVFDDIK